MRNNRNTNLDTQGSVKSESKYAPGLFKKTASHQMSGALAKDEYPRRYTYDEQQPTLPRRLSKKLGGVDSQNSPDQNAMKLSGKTLTPTKNPLSALEQMASFEFKKDTVEDYDREFEENMTAIHQTQKVLQKRLGVDPAANKTGSFKGKWTIFGDTAADKTKGATKASKSLTNKDAPMNKLRSSLVNTDTNYAHNPRQPTTQGASSSKFQSYGAFKLNEPAATGQNYNNRVVQAHQELQHFFAKFEGQPSTQKDSRLSKMSNDLSNLDRDSASNGEMQFSFLNNNKNLRETKRNTINKKKQNANILLDKRNYGQEQVMNQQIVDEADFKFAELSDGDDLNDLDAVGVQEPAAKYKSAKQIK